MSGTNNEGQSYEYFQIEDGESECESEDDISKELLVSPIHRIHSTRFSWPGGKMMTVLLLVLLSLLLLTVLLLSSPSQPSSSSLSSSSYSSSLSSSSSSSSSSSLSSSTYSSSSSVSGAYMPSVLGNYSMAGVAVDGAPCARISKDVMLEGGTAVDGAIAGMICNGGYNSQSMGLGGGFMMTIYDEITHTVHTLDARETAPAAASQDMFRGDPEAAQHGPLSVAVPGEIAGYWAAKERFGNTSISWARLVAPTVKMCREGITVSWTHHTTLHWYNFTNNKMKSVFHNPDTGEPWVEGDVYTRPDYADTLEELARAGDRGEKDLGFYSGPVGKQFVEDLQELGGIITEEDLLGYKAEWTEPVSVHLASLGMTFYSIGPPGSGAILAYILNILDNYNIQPEDDGPLLYHRIVESFKWGFALRTELGDPVGDIRDYVHDLVHNLTSDEWALDKYEKISDRFTVNNASKYGAVYYTPEDHGTAHISVLAPGGSAVSATSTINLYFGSLLMSERTGIIYNDEMDDFSAPNITNYFGVPPSPNNFIAGGKRPLSSMCPSIMLDEEGEVKLVIGAAGGTKITTATALAIMRTLWLKQDIKYAIDSRRVHHQLAPMVVSYEPGVDQEVLDGLEERGHKTELIDKFQSVVVGIEKGEDGRIYANADFRKAGGVDGF